MFARPLRTATTRHLFSPRSQLRFTITARTMATSQTILKLNTGQAFPAVGFGTWQDKESQESAVLEALKAGYRHIDTARMYALLHLPPNSAGTDMSLPQLRHRARRRRRHQEVRRAARGHLRDDQAVEPQAPPGRRGARARRLPRGPGHRLRRPVPDALAQRLPPRRRPVSQRRRRRRQAGAGGLRRHVQGHGEASAERQGEGHRRVQLLARRDAALAQGDVGRAGQPPDRAAPVPAAEVVRRLPPAARHRHHAVFAVSRARLFFGCARCAPGLTASQLRQPERDLQQGPEHGQADRGPGHCGDRQEVQQVRRAGRSRFVAPAPPPSRIALADSVQRGASTTATP